MTPVRRAAALLAGVLALAASTAATAQAGTLTVTGVDQSRFPQVAVTVQGCAAQGGRAVLAVSENGRPIPQSALQVDDPTRSASIALAIDTSQSMRGAPLSAAVGAATGFVQRKRSSDEVAVYSFGKDAGIAQPLTHDRAALTAALGGVAVSAQLGTALYDAVGQASQDLAGAPGRHVLVLLSDGGDSSSQLSLARATASARDAGAVVYAIALQTRATNLAALHTLTSATGGRVYEAAGSGQIAAIYRQVAQDLRTTCRFTYASSAQANGQISLAVRSGGGTATTQFRVTNAGVVVSNSGHGSAVARLARGPFGRVAAAAAVGLATLLVTLLLLAARPEARLDRRISAYTTLRKSDETTRRANGLEAVKALFASTDRVFAHLSYWKRLASAIEQADIAMRPAELFYIQVGAGLLSALIGSLVAGPGVFSIITLALGFAVPFLVVRRKGSRRRKAFEAQLPDVLMGVAASLRAGHSFAQAVASVAKDGDAPASKEFSRVENETRLGRATEVALEGMAKRLGSRNFEFVVMAVNIQRQVGGSLAEILDMVADTVRNREQFSRKVKALTAMGRASAYVLVGMPFFLGMILFVMNRSYMRPLLFTSAGHAMMIGALVSIGIGSAIIRKLVNFRY